MAEKPSKGALEAMNDALEKSRRDAVKSPLTPPCVKESLRKPLTRQD